MKKIVFILVFIIPLFSFSQSARDINTIIQKTIDLHALKDLYSENEKQGETPLIIINDDKIPNNLIVFKFKKRVKIMTYDEIETFKSIFKGSLDSYFEFTEISFTENSAKISATFRKSDKIPINISFKKENNQWLVTESSAG